MDILNQDIFTFYETLQKEGLEVQPLELNGLIIFPFLHESDTRSIAFEVVFPNVESTGIRSAFMQTTEFFPLRGESQLKQALELTNKWNAERQFITSFVSPSSIEIKKEFLYSIFNTSDIMFSMFDLISQAEELIPEIENSFFLI